MVKSRWRIGAPRMDDADFRTIVSALALIAGDLAESHARSARDFERVRRILDGLSSTPVSAASSVDRGVGGFVELRLVGIDGHGTVLGSQAPRIS